MNGKIGYLPEKLIKYRQHENNQIGAKHIINKYKTIEEIRNHFIDVKLGVFETYIQNAQIFSKEIQKRNNDSYNYYKMLKNKPKINFRKWRIFHNLYKNETLKYYIENFLILNIPIIVKIILKIKGSINGFNK